MLTVGDVLITNHVLIGAIVGRLSPNAKVAAAAGVVSHFAADSLPHWGGIDGPVRGRTFLKVAVPDGLIGMTALLAIAATTPKDRRAAVAAGMLGACAPDADKPSILLFGRSCWPTPVNHFHWRIQDEAPDRMPQEIAVAGALTAALALWHRRSRR